MAPSLGIRHPDKGRYFIQCVGASKTRILTQGTHQNKENKKKCFRALQTISVWRFYGSRETTE